MMNLKNMLLISAAAMWSACEKPVLPYDASGTFESDEIIVSAEATGLLHQLNIEEGKTLKLGDAVGQIDDVQLQLRKKQLQASIGAVLSKKPVVNQQLAIVQEQIQVAEKERVRLENLVKMDAATPKQLDDVNAQIQVLKKQLEAQEATLNKTTQSFAQETNPIQVQIEQLDDQIRKCQIINSIEGVVLTQYAKAGELATVGKPLYKIANLTNLTLRAYVTASQLSSLQLGQKLIVLVDDGAAKYKELQGELYWISDKAEFTPKTIQTKEERANLVYAIKIRVKNDGFLKLGMYGEVKF